MTRLSGIQDLIVAQLRDGKRRDLLVSAGAGSGKTLVLVESVIAALRSGISLDRILVVTFTDKAATEMRDRIYRDLEKDDDLAALRLRLPQAWISTIHSFCLRLLRERFEKAGIDPNFRVLSEEDARLLLDDALTRVFHEEYAKRSDAEAFEELVEMCGFDEKGERLRDVIRRFLACARTSERPRDFLGRHASMLRRPFSNWEDLPWAPEYGLRLARAWRAAVGVLRVVADGAGGKLSAIADGLEEIDPADLAHPISQKRVVARMNALGIVKRGEKGRLGISLPSLPPGLGPLKAVKEIAANAFRSEWIDELPIDPARIKSDEGRAARLGLTLISLTQRVWNAYEASKERLGRLDFEDLQIRALDLITDADGTDLAVRFDRVFVDEFQDVNGLQHELLSRVCDPAAMFRVGDIKQSIYQFRLADPEIIRTLAGGRPIVKVRETAPEDALAWNVLLPTNYRSLPPVLAIVNEIARGLFLPAEIGSTYDEQRLVPNPEADAKTGPDVEMLLVHEDAAEGDKAAADEHAPDEAPDADEREKPDLRDFEWTAIARRIREMIDMGDEVRDPETMESRPVRYSDIAILLRAHANAPTLARRLEEEGIACSLGTGEPFFEAPEVRDLLNLLRVTDNLLDDIALAAALRSPAFGWTDAELLCLRLALPGAAHLAYSMAVVADRADLADAILPSLPEERAILCGERETLPDEPPFATLPGRCREAIEPILRWRDAAGGTELPSLVTRVLEETGLPRSVASLPGGLRRQANLRKLIGISRRYSQDAGHSLHRFLRWCESLEERDAKIFQAPVSAESVPAVRIVTIHGAKGLEFPVVILAEMGRRFMLGAGNKALVPGRAYLGVRLLDQADYILRHPLPLRLLIDARDDEGIAEEKRVLYVALTRARDRLILSGVHSKRTIPEAIHQELYRKAIHRGDKTGDAVMHSLLKKKPMPIAWIAYALPPLPGPAPAGAAQRVGDLPLVVRWIAAAAVVESEPAANPIRAIERSLRDLKPVDVPGEPDPDAKEALARTTQRASLPSPGHLATARGKIWATEFKSGRDFVHRIPRDAPDDGETDEAASPLVPDTGAADAAAAEGTTIHALLERLDFAGCDATNLAARVEDAAARIDGIAPAACDVVLGGIARLLALPIGAALASTPAGALHREVAFSLRVPILEITQWMPDLRAEILTSDEWKDWVEADGDGASLRIRADRSPEAGAHWVLVQGRIDAAFRDADGGWTVLDWKSDRIPAEGPLLDERVALYRGQMEIYRRAVRDLFGSPVRAALFFLRPGMLRDV